MVTDSIILICCKTCIKDAKTMCMVLGTCIIVNFKIVNLIFSSICYRYTLDLPHSGNSDVFPTTSLFYK